MHRLLAFTLLATLAAAQEAPVPTVKPAADVTSTPAPAAAPLTPATADMASADASFHSGKFSEAADAYASILKATPSGAAHAGLIHALLRQQKLDEAEVAAAAAIAAYPTSAQVLAANGDLKFRLGEMAEAEKYYLGARKADPKEVRAYLGLSKLYSAYSLRRKAFDELKAAHEIDPKNADVRRAWMNMIPRRERVAEIEAYLAGPHPDDQEETESMKRYLAFLEATVDKPVHACRLKSKVDTTETKLMPLMSSPTRARGYGISVKLNDHNFKLMLDTGAGGIMVGRKAAEKAGLTKVSDMMFSGIGDKGLQSGYVAVAEHLTVGDLEFEDCIVSVSDKGSIMDEDDGLIGANVFSSYLVDLDLPEFKLKLSPLPKRPEDEVAPTSLTTDNDARNNADSAQPTATAPAAARTYLPRDRYVAPEMKDWSKVFRFGHQVLIPTLVNQSTPVMFLLDTGAFANTMSVRAAKKFTKVHDFSQMHVKGLNGEVGKVFKAEKVDLVFGHYRQSNLDMVTFDLSSISRHTGTEVSGILGQNLLHMLDVKIDYRDGLVDFEAAKIYKR